LDIKHRKIVNKRICGFLFWAIFASIFIPLRYISMVLFDGAIWPSIFLIFTLTITMLVLSRNRKLGWFGEQFIIKFNSMHNHKKKILIYIIPIVLICSSITLITMINYGNNQYYDLKFLVVDELSVYGVSLDNVSVNENIDITNLSNMTPIEKIFASISVSMSITNDIFDGWTLYSLYIALIGEIEILVILLTTRFLVPKINNSNIIKLHK